jgi:hypothetical protein
MRTPNRGLLMGALLAAGLAGTTQAQATSSQETPVRRGGQIDAATTDVIDFENLPAAGIASTVFGAGGSGPILVNGFNPAFGAGTNAALVFDSSHRTGGDSDLGSPNSDFGGPGIDGSLGDNLGGEAGSPFQNDAAQSHVLIIAEDLVDSNNDGFIDDPDDAALPGSMYSFDFSALGGVTLHEMVILDVEADESTAVVQFFDARSRSLGATVMLPHTGDNGLATVDLGDVSGVYAMALTLNGSGAIDDIVYTVSSGCDGRIGDLVWLDENCNGIQDGEPGIPAVRIDLKNRAGALVSSTVTNASGRYRFTDLCADRYTVCVDESTLPARLEPAPCDQGSDDRIDSECSPHTITLGPDEWNATIDFGYCDTPDGGAEGCTPGYWKQQQHFDSWPAPYTPWTDFSDVFDDAIPGKTLQQVVKQGGGGLAALGRHTVAALLNAASPGVDYGPSPTDVIDMFNAANPSDYEDLKDVFVGLNESGCPLN